jgi:carboxymethylenebutenolidase
MGVRGTMTKMKMSDGAEIGVYHVEPEGARRGGLVVIQEIFGVNEHIREVCEDYAKDGYEVLSPALYDREAPGFETGYSPDEIQKAIKIARGEHPFDLSIKDTLTCIDALASRGKVFITGYCYGGTVTWAAACRSDNLAAASGYYGGQIALMNDQNPKCPTMLHFGETDHGIPMSDVDKIRAAHPDVQVFVYPAVGHGFNCNYRPDYDAEAAKLAKQRTLELFSANGG